MKIYKVYDNCVDGAYIHPTYTCSVNTHSNVLYYKHDSKKPPGFIYRSLLSSRCNIIFYGELCISEIKNIITDAIFKPYPEGHNIFVLHSGAKFKKDTDKINISIFNSPYTGAYIYEEYQGLLDRSYKLKEFL